MVRCRWLWDCGRLGHVSAGRVTCRQACPTRISLIPSHVEPAGRTKPLDHTRLSAAQQRCQNGAGQRLETLRSDVGRVQRLQQAVVPCLSLGMLTRIGGFQLPVRGLQCLLLPRDGCARVCEHQPQNIDGYKPAGSSQRQAGRTGRERVPSSSVTTLLEPAILAGPP